MSEAVQGAIVGGLIGLIGSLVVSRATLRTEHQLKRRGELLYEIEAWTAFNPGGDNARDLSLLFFNNTQTDAAFWKIGIEFREEEEGPRYKLMLSDALTRERVDTMSLPSGQPVSCRLRAFEDTDIVPPDAPRPSMNLELVGEMPGGKEFRVQLPSWHAPPPAVTKEGSFEPFPQDFWWELWKSRRFGA
jgi:hypothetical protein